MITRRKILIGGAAMAAPIVLGGAASAIAIRNNKAYQDPIVVSHVMLMPQWPQDLNLTVAFLSDIHLGLAMNAPRLANTFHMVNALNADLVLLGGDYFDGSQSRWNEPAREEDLRSIASLRAPAIGVPGNHDWKFGLDTVKSAFARANLPLLQNQSTFIQKGGRRVWIAGLDSQWGKSATFFGGRENHANVKDAFRNIPLGEPTIVLMHEPDAFHALPAQAQACFAGHTHGGQIQIGKAKPLTWLSWQFTSGLIYGHAYSHDLKRQIIVSSGLGCSRVPVRTLAPEIMHVILRGMKPV